MASSGGAGLGNAPDRAVGFGFNVLNDTPVDGVVTVDNDNWSLYDLLQATNAAPGVDVYLPVAADETTRWKRQEGQLQVHPSPFPYLLRARWVSATPGGSSSPGLKPTWCCGRFSHRPS